MGEGPARSGLVRLSQGSDATGTTGICTATVPQAPHDKRDKVTSSLVRVRSDTRAVLTAPGGSSGQGFLFPSNLTDRGAVSQTARYPLLSPQERFLSVLTILSELCVWMGVSVYACR